MNVRPIRRLRRLLRKLRRADTRQETVRRLRRRIGRALGRRPPKRSAGSGRAPARARPTAIASPPRQARPSPQPATARPPRRKPDAWYVGEWARLASATLGRDLAPDRSGADVPLAAEAGKEAVRLRARSAVAAALERGEPLEAAVCRAIAELTAAEEWYEAWSLAEGVGRVPGGEAASALGHGLLLHRRRQQFARAWSVLRPLPDETLRTYLPVEAVDAALADGSAEARERARSIGVPTPTATPAVLVDLAGRFLAVGDAGRAAELIAELRSRRDVSVDDRRRHAWRRIEEWLAPRPIAVPDGAVPIGVLDYGTPDHVLTSGNLGDYVQTLSLLGNLARMQRVEFTGEGGLGTLAAELQGRVRQDLRLDGPSGRVHLLPVDRDFSSPAPVPPGTWLMAFGWHMHPLFHLRHDFPYHPNIRPLFVSFQVNRVEMLTDEARDYLRRYGPVGCRDWHTVFLLLSAGIDAFFSGCLTTTADAVFPPRSEAHRTRGTVGVIDLPARLAGDADAVRTYTHQSDDVRYMSLPDGVRAAAARLAEYQRDLDRVVTGRLHAYLPLTSLGVPVEFAPRSPGDVRFSGLAGLTPDDPRLDEIRGGIRELLAATLDLIVAGAPPDEVYARWRELTKDRVAEAKQRFEAPVSDPPTTIDIAAAVAASTTGARRFGPHDTADPARATDIVLAFDANLTHPAGVLIESLLSNASGPLRVWILGRGLPAGYDEWLASAFPDLPITFVPCDAITYGPSGRPRRIPLRITISTMDRLLLPEMLPDVDRVVYLDVDTIAHGDITELASVDLGGRAIAARDSNVTEESEWRRAGRHLPEPVATELRRRMALQHGFGTLALNAGVLVMDLARMRRDGFTRRALGWVEHYGLNDQDSMLAYVGPDRYVLEPRWNTLPIFEDVPDPQVVHWASLGKPWRPELTYGQDRWRAYAASLRARAGDPPSGDGAAASAPPAPSGSLTNPIDHGPSRAPRPEPIERVIQAVRDERLSYLDLDALRTLAESVESIEADGIAGLVIEAGTARGGSAITLAAAKAPGRPMRVYDVFGMIPPPSDRDGEDVHRRYETIVRGESRGIAGDQYYGYRENLLGEVADAFARLGLPLAEHNVELVPGRFQDTIRGDEPVALAHLDGDWYESTMTCLTRIAPRLARGGRIIVDDYDTWSGCRTAVHEYFAGRDGYRFERRGRLHIVRE